LTAIGATSLATDELKSIADRERPNGLDRESFPSGHTSSSAVQTRLASNNLRSIAMNAPTRRLLDAGLAAMTIGTAWARIEAGFHYPSDTLFSIALGNFIASFVDQAFLGSTNLNGVVAIVPVPDGAVVQWNWRF
jgi:membrane-associated phospholipid phosphatase